MLALRNLEVSDIVQTEAEDHRASKRMVVLWLEPEFPDFHPGAISIRTYLGK